LIKFDINTWSRKTTTRLNQVFVVNETDRVLSFRLSNLTLDDVENAPDDAFFNLQANQSVYNMGSALISTC
jgi:hypothetical protein